MAVCGSARSCHLYLYAGTLTQTVIDRGAQASGGSALLLLQPRGGFCAKAKAGASDREARELRLPPGRFSLRLPTFSETPITSLLIPFLS